MKILKGALLGGAMAAAFAGFFAAPDETKVHRSAAATKTNTPRRRTK